MLKWYSVMSIISFHILCDDQMSKAGVMLLKKKKWNRKLLVCMLVCVCVCVWLPFVVCETTLVALLKENHKIKLKLTG